MMMRIFFKDEGFSKEGFFSLPKFRVFLSLNVFCPFQKHLLFLHGFSSTFNLKEEKRNKKSARVVLHENLL